MHLNVRYLIERNVLIKQMSIYVYLMWFKRQDYYIDDVYV